MESFSADLSECYRILELTPQATLEEIKSAYRQLVKRYHPDRNPGDRQAAERFIQINQAYETLLEAGEREALGQPTQPPDPARSAAKSGGQPKVYVRRSAPRSAHLTPEQERLKQRSLELIFALLQQRQWQQAARHLEGLASRCRTTQIWAKHRQKPITAGQENCSIDGDMMRRVLICRRR